MTVVPLASLLTNPAWAGRHRVLGGRVGTASVASVQVLGDGEAPRPAEFALVALPLGRRAANTPDWRLDALLRRASDAGASTVLLPGTEELAATTRLLCARLSICVLGTSGSVLDLAVAAAVALANPGVTRAHAILAVQSAVAQGRVTRPGALVDLLGDVLAVGVALHDGVGELLDGASGLPGPRWGEPVVQQVPAPVTGANLQRRGTVIAQPVLLAGVRAPQRWLVAHVPAERGDAADTVADCLAVAAAVLAGWLAIERLGLERDARSRTGLLADVLRVSGDTPAHVRRRASAAGWTLEGWHIGVRVGTSSAVDTAGLRDDVVRAFGSAGVDAVVVEDADGWSAWWTTPREPGAERVRELAGSLRIVHRGLQEIVDCWMGVGRPQAGAAGIVTTLAEAADAAGLAAGRPEQGRFLHVDQLGVAQTLLAWTRTSTFAPAARSLLEPLGNGDLLPTLSAYLDAESSLVETAAVLGVHRNTVAARVARIERLLRVDLTDRDQRLALQLACRAVGVS
ncbi:MAG: PucR family transcriptional regulator [Janthinobacterium lividum]